MYNKITCEYVRRNYAACMSSEYPQHTKYVTYTIIKCLKATQPYINTVNFKVNV